MSDKLFLNFADGVPLANLDAEQTARLLEFVENDMPASDAVRELADGLRRSLAQLREADDTEQER